MPIPSGRPRITHETPGPALAVLAICSAGASALVAGSAIAYQFKHRHLARGSKLDLEWNILLLTALIVSIAQSAVTAVQVDNGLGYPMELMTTNEVPKFLKLEYANNLLYIASLLLLKGVQFLLQISTTFQKPNYWLPALVLLGMLGFLFTAAFGCSSPFWMLRGNKCINQSAFWIVFGVFDIVSDIYSVTVVIWVSSGLNLRTTNKAKLLIILASKFLPVACAIARLPFIYPAYTSSQYTITLYKLAMPTQIQLHLSVMALSLGKVFRFLTALDVGYLSSSIEPNHGKGSTNHSRAGKYGYNSNKSTKHSVKGTTKDDVFNDHESSKNLVPSDYNRTITEVEGAIPMDRMHSARARQDSSALSQRSGSVPEIHPRDNEIRVTTRFEVRTE